MKNVGIVKVSRFEKKTWFDQQKNKKKRRSRKGSNISYWNSCRMMVVNNVL